jgi:hypothetical protein
MDGYEYIDNQKRIGLVYSPDDNGWYWQKLFGDWLTSQIFNNRQAAMRADEKDMYWS